FFATQPVSAALLTLSVGSPPAAAHQPTLSLLGGLLSDPITVQRQKIHPLLLLQAQDTPLSSARVIVQKSGPSVLTSLLTTLVPGLTVVEDFQVVPAFVATVPLALLPTLAGLSDIRYVSPDGPIQVLPNLQGVLSIGGGSQGSTAGTGNWNVDGSRLSTTYPIDTGATQAWTGADGHTGTGRNVTVAV